MPCRSHLHTADGDRIVWTKTRLEAMAWYQKRYGLKPTGRHRDLAHQLIGPCYRRCIKCKGWGYLPDHLDDSCRVCPNCHGSGHILVVSQEELLERRAEVLAQYPEAAAPMEIPEPSAGVVIHDLAGGKMIVVPRDLESQ